MLDSYPMASLGDLARAEAEARRPQKSETTKQCDCQDSSADETRDADSGDYWRTEYENGICIFIQRGDPCHEKENRPWYRASPGPRPQGAVVGTILFGISLRLHDDFGFVIGGQVERGEVKASAAGVACAAGRTPGA